MEPSDRAAVLFAPYFFARASTASRIFGMVFCWEIRKVCADGGDERAVIGAEIEVLFPERKRFVRAVGEETVRRPGNFQIVCPADE